MTIIIIIFAKNKELKIDGFLTMSNQFLFFSLLLTFKLIIVKALEAILSLKNSTKNLNKENKDKKDQNNKPGA